MLSFNITSQTGENKNFRRKLVSAYDMGNA